MRFTLFGFPVRVHPLFLLGPTLFGKGLIAGEGIIGVRWLIVVAVFFVSILFHELGHAWAHRYFGMGSRIVLYWMGGLAIRERNPWMSGGHRVAGEAHSQQMVISLAGPVASVVLVIAMIGLGVAIGGALLWGRILVFPLPSVFQDKSKTNQQLLIRISVSDFRTVPSGCWSRRAQPTLSLLGFAQKANVEHVAPEGPSLLALPQLVTGGH